MTLKFEERKYFQKSEIHFCSAMTIDMQNIYILISPRENNALRIKH